MCFSRTFSFISQVPDTLAVQPQAGVSFFFFPLYFLEKTDSFVVSSPEKRRLLFIPQRLVFLLQSMAMEMFKIQSSLSALKLLEFVVLLGWFVCLFCVVVFLCVLFWFFVSFLFGFVLIVLVGCVGGFFIYLNFSLFGFCWDFSSVFSLLISFQNWLKI